MTWNDFLTGYYDSLIWTVLLTWLRAPKLGVAAPLETY